MMFSGCTTSPKPSVVTEIKPVTRHMPASLKRRCPDIWMKPGAAAGDRLRGARSTGDLLDRGNVNEARLIECAARMDAVITWDKGN